MFKNKWTWLCIFVLVIGVLYCTILPSWGKDLAQRPLASLRGTLCQEELGGGVCFGDLLKPLTLNLSVEPIANFPSVLPLVGKSMLYYPSRTRFVFGYSVSLTDLWGVQLDRSGISIPTPVENLHVTGNAAVSIHWKTGMLEVKHFSSALSWRLEKLGTLALGFEKRNEPITEWHAGVSLRSRF